MPGVAGPRRLAAPRRPLVLAWERGVGPRPTGADVVHAPTPLMPPGGGPRVVTVNDAVPWTHPDTLTPRGVHWHRLMVDRAVRTGAVITTLTGGTGEAVGDTAVIVEAGNVAALADALDRVVLEMSEHERRSLERRGREHALAFEAVRVFDDLFRPGPGTATVVPVELPDEQAV